MALEHGDIAPDFTLPDQDGQPVALAALRGKPSPAFRTWGSSGTSSGRACSASDASESG